MNLQPPKHAQAAFTEFDVTLPTILSGPGRQFPKELADSKVLAEIHRWIFKTFEYSPARCVLRRFLAGEFTGGASPYHIPDLQLIHVEKMLRTLDVIEAMAHVADTRHRVQEAVEGSPVVNKDGLPYEPPPGEPVPAPAPTKPSKSKQRCDVLDCTRPYCAKGLCATHYQQQRPKRSRSSKDKPESPEPPAEPAQAGDEQGAT